MRSFAYDITTHNIGNVAAGARLRLQTFPAYFGKTGIAYGTVTAKLFIYLLRSQRIAVTENILMAVSS